MPESESVVLSIKRYEQTVKVVKYCRDTILFPPASSLCSSHEAETPQNGRADADANTARVVRGAADRVAEQAFP